MFCLRIILSSLLLFSCGPGFSDFVADLGNSYYFADTNALDKIIYYENNDKASTVIGNLVVSYNRKGNFIVALRQPERKHHKQVAIEKMFERKCEYWIIDTGNRRILGPLAKDEYFDKIKIIGIPENALETPASSGVPMFCFKGEANSARK
ncbi:MAG: hypothetical protein Q9M12_03660 [Mariprofundus sp.]|nr:hypothetical protein [Mariprofundus sp.]